MDVRITLDEELDHARGDLRLRILFALSRFDRVIGRVTVIVTSRESGSGARCRVGYDARIRVGGAAGPLEFEHFGVDPGDAVQSVLSRTARALARLHACGAPSARDRRLRRASARALTTRTDPPSRSR